MVSAFRLHAISDIALVRGLGVAVVEDVANIRARGVKKQAGETPEQRHLQVQRPPGFQIAQDSVIGGLALALIQLL